MLKFQIEFKSTVTIEAETSSDALKVFDSLYPGAHPQCVDRIGIVGVCLLCRSYVIEESKYINYPDGRVLCAGCIRKRYSPVAQA